MLIKSKVVGVLACGSLLGLGLSSAIQAAEKHPAEERMRPNASAEKTGDLVKPDENTVEGISTVRGEVLRLKGEHVHVRLSDGKEVHLHIKPTTQMTAEFKKGDHIEAKVNDQNDAVSVRQTK